MQQNTGNANLDLRKRYTPCGGEGGFSLVEFIVVIAIMGVLMVVLAPQYLKYVEKTRLQKDNAAIGEIAESIKLAYTDAVIAGWVAEQGSPVVFTAAGGMGENKTFAFDADSINPLERELADTIGSVCTTSSGTYKNTGQSIAISVSDDEGSCTIWVRGLIESPGGTAVSRHF